MRLRRPIHAGPAFIVVFSTIAASCAHHPRHAAIPPSPARPGKTEIGVASWYGAPYHGRQTASGEIYDMYLLTAAHRNLPFETWVEVENLSNGKRVDVRINDRGPFVGHRIIDLSQTAAQEIDMLGPGTARVRLTVLARPQNIPIEVAVPPVSKTIRSDAKVLTPPTRIAPASEARPFYETPPPTISTPPPATIPIPPMPRYAVQAGAFVDRERAEALRVSMTEAFAEARTLVDSTRTPPLWRVLVGREMTREQATNLAARVRSKTGAAIVVPETAGAVSEKDDSTTDPPQ
jgi:rare lipoprotein A